MDSTLLVRGPITAMGIFMSLTAFGLGGFFINLHNSIQDCAFRAATASACGVDVFETVTAAIIAVGSASSYIYLGLITPLPRDLVQQRPVFRVDGRDVDWVDGMHHKFGVNRTFEDPAIVEFQHNSSASLHTYHTYQDGEHLIMRHDLGIDIPNPARKRSTCKGYLDTIISMDTLKASELAHNPGYNGFRAVASSIIQNFASKRFETGCVFMGSDDGIAGAKFQLGGGCGETPPRPRLNCNNADYSDPIYRLSTGG